MQTQPNLRDQSWPLWCQASHSRTPGNSGAELPTLQAAPKHRDLAGRDRASEGPEQCASVKANVRDTEVRLGPAPNSVSVLRTQASDSSPVPNPSHSSRRVLHQKNQILLQQAHGTPHLPPPPPPPTSPTTTPPLLASLRSWGKDRWKEAGAGCLGAWHRMKLTEESSEFPLSWGPRGRA